MDDVSRIRDRDSEAPSRRREKRQTHQLMTPQAGNPPPDRPIQSSVIHHLMRLNQAEIVGWSGMRDTGTLTLTRTLP